MRVKLLSAAAIVAIAMFGSSPTRAETIDLGFALDSSGSILSSGWTLERDGLAAALLANIPTTNGIGKNSPNGNTYILSVVQFDDQVRNTLTATITDQASLISFTNTIKTWAFTGGSTCISCATDALTANFSATIGTNRSLLNISTDGDPNLGVQNGTTLHNNLVSAGWDGVSAEAIGSGANVGFLDLVASPGSALNTSDPSALPDPFTRGFVLTIDNIADYQGAIDAKIANIVNVPIGPAGSGLPGLLAALGCFVVLARYRRRAAASYAA